MEYRENIDDFNRYFLIFILVNLYLILQINANLQMMNLNNPIIIILVVNLVKMNVMIIVTIIMIIIIQFII